MGIVKVDKHDVNKIAVFQSAVLATLDEYDYDIADLRYIEELKQIVITIKGVVLFVTEIDISISFEINIKPDFVANLILILAERIAASKIHVTDSFLITTDAKGKKIAVFGSDAQEIYERDLGLETYHNKYFDILTNSSIKFYDC
jgi:hypothetical protein